MTAGAFTLPEERVVEAMSAEEILALCLGEFPGQVALACSFQKEESVLLDLLFGIEPKARVFAIDTHYPLPADVRAVAQDRAEVRHDRRGVRGPEPRGPRGDPRRRALGSQARSLSRDRQGRAARAGAGRPRRLDHRHPPRPVADACRRAEARLGRVARAVEGEPACRLERRRLLGIHPRAWAALQRAARPRLRLDRRHPLDEPGAGREGRWAGSDRTECGLHVGGEAA